MTSLLDNRVEQHTPMGVSTLLLPGTTSNETVSIPDDDFFEGPEKTLEMWFRPTVPVVEGKHPSGRIGLRLIPREKLEELLALVKCTVLSTTQTEYMDSYVLSESSMFVSPYRFILKTCGRTTLLWAVRKILQFAAEVGLTDVEEMFFSRRHFGKPELQRYPHTSFDEEVKYLDEIFDGSAYTFGKHNSNDLWHLYTLNNPVEDPAAMPCMDKTLEVIMSHLDPAAMSNFFQSDRIRTAADVERESGIASLFPDAKLDGFLFSPCGYSVNGLMNEYYFTIHVTPQDGFSYVSFETDVPMEDYTALIDHVVKIFRPGHFSVNLFVTERRRDKHFNHKVLSDYTREYNMMHEFEHYDVLFSRFVCNPAPRTRRSSKVKALLSEVQVNATVSDRCDGLVAEASTEDGCSTAVAAAAAAGDGILIDSCIINNNNSCDDITPTASSNFTITPTTTNNNNDSSSNNSSDSNGGSSSNSARQSPHTVEPSSASDMSDSESCEGSDGSDSCGSR